VVAVEAYVETVVEELNILHRITTIPNPTYGWILSESGERFKFYFDIVPPALRQHIRIGVRVNFRGRVLDRKGKASLITLIK